MTLCRFDSEKRFGSVFLLESTPFLGQGKPKQEDPSHFEGPRKNDTPTM